MGPCLPIRQVGFFKRSQHDELKRLLEEKEAEEEQHENEYILDEEEFYEQPVIDHIYAEPSFPDGASKYDDRAKGGSSVSSVNDCGACAVERPLLHSSGKAG